MVQAIDLLPLPAQPRKMKVVVASCSRTGTLSLYKAMNVLGYKSYHMVECCLAGGIPHMKVLEEAVVAYHNRFSGLRRLESEDFKKWLGEYDCLVELASYVGADAINAYADDPDVKFILTERNPDSWVRSFNNTVSGIIKLAESPPTSILQYFDATMQQFFRLNVAMYDVWSDSTRLGDKTNHDKMRRNYTDYIEMVKKTIPADRLLVIKLEDGLDWKQICPFLSKDIPNEPYPPKNDPKEFEAMLQAWLGPKVTLAMVRLGAVVTPLIGISALAGIKYGPTFLQMLRRQ